MTRDIQLSNPDLRYEGRRMKATEVEVRLLVSIQERGIKKPLEGVDVQEERILLNGLKLNRGAKRMGWGAVPHASFGANEAMGMLEVHRAASEPNLTLFEQADLIDDLLHRNAMNVAEIAETLSRSTSWVAMRLGWVCEVGAEGREKVPGGRFPSNAVLPHPVSPLAS